MQHQHEKITRMRDVIWKIGNNRIEGIIFPLSSPNRIKRCTFKACRKLYEHPLKCYFPDIISLSSMKVSNATDQTDFFIECLTEALRDSSRQFQEWEAAIQCNQNKDKASADERQWQNRGDVTQRHQSSSILVSFINSFRGLTLKSPGGEKSNLRCCGNFWL